MIGWIVFACGGSVCALNGYLSWLRYPLHRARGHSRESFRWVSGVPLVGSALVIGAWAVWLRGPGSPWIDGSTGLLLAIDAGGPHWFVAQLVRERLRRRNSTS